MWRGLHEQISRGSPNFLNYVAETSKAWDEPNPREAERMGPAANSMGGMY